MGLLGLLTGLGPLQPLALDITKTFGRVSSDLQDNVDWGRKWLIDFNALKTQLLSFDQSNNTNTIDEKIDGFVLEEKSSLKMLELNVSSKFDWSSYIISIAKTASKKVGALIHFMKFFF